MINSKEVVKNSPSVPNGNLGLRQYLECLSVDVFWLGSEIGHLQGSLRQTG